MSNEATTRQSAAGTAATATAATARNVRMTGDGRKVATAALDAYDAVKEARAKASPDQLKTGTPSATRTLEIGSLVITVAVTVKTIDLPLVDWGK